MPKPTAARAAAVTPTARIRRALVFNLRGNRHISVREFAPNAWFSPRRGTPASERTAVQALGDPDDLGEAGDLEHRPDRRVERHDEAEALPASLESLGQSRQ